YPKASRVTPLDEIADAQLSIAVGRRACRLASSRYRRDRAFPGLCADLRRSPGDASRSCVAEDADKCSVRVRRGAHVFSRSARYALWLVWCRARKGKSRYCYGVLPVSAARWTSTPPALRTPCDLQAQGG